MHLEKSGGSRQIARIARRFSAYLPHSLTTKLLNQQMPEPGRARWVQAATLFCDVSGFSAMANELAADGSRGAEELNRLLLMIFTAMINAIHNAGGIVVHFHGDAMLVFIPDDDGQAAQNALSCAQFMQNLMRGSAYSEVVASRPNNQQTTFSLSMKVGVGYGRCAEIVVGDLKQQMEYVVGGPGIDDCIEAETYAKAGQVIASAAVLHKAGLTIHQAYQPFSDLMPVPFARNRIHWDAYNSDTLWNLAETAANFVPVPLHKRISDVNAYYVAENRPITTLFVSFTGIDYEDPEVGSCLQEYYEWACRLVAQYGGENSRVNRILTGDKGDVLHIVFGAPMAPDDPEHALLCAWEMQKQKPDFIQSQSIGVAAGEAFACAIGSQTRREYTVMGEVVNLSARLMGKCPDGEVWVDEATYRRVNQQILFDEIGLVPLKGYNEPLRLYRMLGDAKQATTESDYQANQLPLLWREQEVAMLQNVLQAGLEGESRALIVEGESPSELARMTTLANEYWQERGGRVLFGVGQQALTEFPYSLWRNVWQTYFEYTDQDHVSLKVRQVTEKIMASCPEFASDLPLLEKVLGFNFPGQTRIIGLSDLQEQARLYALLMALLLADTEQDPLLLVLENVHWGDTDSMHFLHYLMRSSQDTKLALFLSFTPQKSFRFDQLPRVGRHIELGQISVDVACEVVEKMLGLEALPAELISYFGLDNADTTINPIILEENVKRLRTESRATQDGDFQLDETLLSNLNVPRDLRGLVLSKLDSLSPNAHKVLQAASILGRQFDYQTLLNTLIPSISRPLATRLFKELVAAELISVVRDGEVYIFRGETVHDSAYKSIPYRRRQLWHATVAQWLAKQEAGATSMYPIIAYHYGQTDLYEEGLHFSFEAAENMRNQSKQAAIELYNLAENHLRGLGFEHQWETAVKLYLSRADLHNLTEQFTKAEQDGEAAVRLAYHHYRPDYAGRAYNQLAYAKFRLGKLHQAFELCTHVIERFGDQISMVDLGYAHAYGSEILLHLGQFDQARLLFERAVDLFREDENRPGMAYCMIMWGYEHYSVLGEWESARLSLNQGRELIEPRDQTYLVNSVRFFIGLAHVELSDSEGTADFALHCVQQAEKICLERDMSWWLSAVYYYQALIQVEKKRPQEAEKSLQLAHEWVEKGSNPDYLPLILLQLSHLETDTAQADRYLSDCVQAAQARSRYFDQRLCLIQANKYSQSMQSAAMVGTTA